MYLFEAIYFSHNTPMNMKRGLALEEVAKKELLGLDVVRWAGLAQEIG